MGKILDYGHFHVGSKGYLSIGVEGSDNEVHVFHEDRMKRRQGNLVWRVEEPLNFKMLL